MRKITYCEGWFLGRQKPIGVMDEIKAKKLHDKGKTFAALLGNDPYRPEVAVTFTKGVIIIEYFDENLRLTSRALYGDPEDRRFFLKSLTGKGGRIEGTKDGYETVELIFHKDGTGHTLHWTLDGMYEKSDTIWPHIERHWHPIPEFGDYESIVAAPMNLSDK